MTEHSFWNWPLPNTIITGVILILATFGLNYWQEKKRTIEEKGSKKTDDFKTLRAILEYLNVIETSLNEVKESICPSHIIPPSLKDIKFSSNIQKLEEISSTYNHLVHEIYQAENFIKIQAPPQELGDLGMEVVGKKHRELRNKILNKIKILKKMIEKCLKPSWVWKPKWL